jgi:ABC-type polar amino acid transport system ATPase subunit
MVGSWSPGGRVGLDRRRETLHRSHVGMVFQRFELFPHLTALQNVSLGPRMALKVSKKEARERALEQLALVGLADHAHHRPHQLSGGQQQRVGIARSLAMQPKVLLFDEPTSALDPELVDEVLTVMLRLAGSGMTMVVVTHEIRFAMNFADRLLVFDRGQIVEQGPPAAIVSAPQQQVTESFLRSLHAK